jgi:hypothetical protein
MERIFMAICSEPDLPTYITHIRLMTMAYLAGHKYLFIGDLAGYVMSKRMTKNLVSPVPVSRRHTRRTGCLPLGLEAASTVPKNIKSGLISSAWLLRCHVVGIAKAPIESFW